VVEISDLPPRYRPADEVDSCGSPEMPAAPATQPEVGPPAATAPAPLLSDTDVLRLLEVPGAAVLAADTGEAAEGRGGLASLPAEGLDLRAHLAAIERALIEQALARTQGTVAHAARLLNLRRTTLVERLRKLGLLAPPGASEV